MKKIILLLLCLFGLHLQSKAQVVSTEGKEFYVGFMTIVDNSGRTRLVISSKLGATGTITQQPSGTLITTFDVPAGTTKVYDIGATAGAYRPVINEVPESNKVIYVKSDNNDISVTANNSVSNRTEASSVLPITSLGAVTEYIVNTSAVGDTFAGSELSEFLIVAYENNTVVEITPTINTSGGKIAGTMFTVNLLKGQMVQYVAANRGQDFSGTRIKAADGTCKPFAVFAGSQASTLCRPPSVGPSSWQHTYEQQYPLETWGKKYIVMPFQNANDYWYRVVAREDNTTVTIKNTAGVDEIVNLNATQNVAKFITAAASPFYISADKAISVSQMTLTSACSGAGQGDVSLVILNPLNQTTKQTTFNTLPLASIGSHYVNIIMKTVDVPELRFNSATTDPSGNLLTALFTPVPQLTDYSVATIFIGTTAGGLGVTPLTSTLSSTKEFIAYAYGYSSTDVYAYSVGASFENQAYNFTINPNPLCDPNRTVTVAGSGINIATYSWDFGDGSPIVTGQNPPPHTYAAAGFYEITMTVTFVGGGVGCSATGVLKKQAKIYPTAPPTASIGTDQTVCEKTNVVLTAPNGPDQTYEWYKDGVFITGATLQSLTLTNVNATNTGAYKVKITRGGICEVTSNTVNVVVIPLPVVNLTPLSASFCAGGTVLLTANTTVTPGVTYEWRRNDVIIAAGATSNTYLANLAGSYTVFAISAAPTNCRSLVSNAVIVELIDAPTVTIKGQDDKTYFCAGESLQLQGTALPALPTYTYQWQFKPTPLAAYTDIVGATAINYTTNVVGYYRLRVTNPITSCQSFSTPDLFIEQKALPSATLLTSIPPIICEGTTITFSTTPIPTPALTTFKYEWFENNIPIGGDFATYSNIYNTAGIFNMKVKITDNTTNCTFTTPEVALVVNPMPNVNVNVPLTVFCANTNTTLTAQTAPAGQVYNYQWKRDGVDIAGETNSTLLVTTSGSYTVQITTDKNCVKTSNPAVITVNPMPTANIAATLTTLCSAVTTTLSVTTTPTVAETWTYEWQRNGTPVVGETNNTLITNTSGNYAVKITNQFGCFLLSNIIPIIVNPSPDPTIAATPTVLCQGENTVINTVPVPAGQTWAYQWIRNGTDIVGQTNPTLTVTTTGNYAVRITTALGCVLTTPTPLPITVNPLPVVSITGVNASYCSNAATVDLAGKGTPAGGVFTLTEGTNPPVIVTQINPTALTPGAYTLTYIYTNPTTSCVNSATQAVFINNVVPVNITNLEDKYCINDAVFVLTGSGVGGTGQFFVNANPAPITSFNPTNLGILPQPITIKYVYTYGTGCSEEATKTVTINQLPTVSITGLATQYCSNGLPIDLVATVAPTGGTGVFKINGVTVTGTPPKFNPVTLGSGNHLVEYFYTDLNGCENKASQNVEVLAPTALTFLGLGTKYCENVADITLAANPAGGTFFVNGVPETKFRPATLGTGVYAVKYVYTAPGLAACKDEITRAVTVVAPTKVFYATPIKKDYCVSDADFLLVPTPAGAVVTIDGLPAPAGALPNTYIFSPATLGARTVPYIVKSTFVDANACVDVLESQVFVNPLPVVTMTGVNPDYCLNDIAFTPIVNPTGGVFSIAGSNIAAPIKPSTLGVGTYILRYTFKDAKTCEKFVETTFTVKPLPTPVITTVLAPNYCVSSPAFALNATPLGGKFFINGAPVTGLPNNAVNSVIFTPATIGISPNVEITYSYTAANGCTATTTVSTKIIAEPAAPTFTDLVTCKSATPIRLNAYLPSHDVNISYVWRNKGTGVVLATTPSLIVDATGIYTVQITDARACNPVIAEAKVTVNPNPVVNLGADRTVCGNQTIVLDADPTGSNTGNFKYKWSTGATTKSITINSATIRGTRAYSVEVTDENFPSKCVGRDEILLFFNDIPVVDLGSDRAICNPSQVPYKLIGYDVSHASLNVTYKWTNPFAANPSATLATTPNYDITVPGVYTVAVTTANGCTTRDTVEILFDGDPSLKILGADNDGKCLTEATLFVQATNVLDYEITWEGPGIISTTPDKLSVKVNKSGRYTVKVKDKKKETKCNAAVSVDVFIADFPDAVIKPVTVGNSIVACQDNTLVLDAYDVSHLSSIKYEWRNLTTNAVVGTSAKLNLKYSDVNTFDPVRFSVKITPPSNCVSTDIVTVTFQPRPIATIDNNFPKQICLGESFTLRASGGDTYKWTSNDDKVVNLPTTPTLTMTPGAEGTYFYTVEVSNANSKLCESTKVTATIVVNPAMTVKLPAQKEVKSCEDTPIEVDVFDPTHPFSVRYTWKNVATGEIVGNASRQKFDFASIKPQPTYNPVLYEVSVTDGVTGCVAKDILKVIFVRKAKPIINKNIPLQYCLGEEITLTASQGSTYRWSTGATGESIKVTPLTTGTFTYSVSSRFDELCSEGTDEITLQINPIPTVIANANKDLKICAGDKITLTATGAVRYEWEHGDKTASTTVSPTKDTWYVVYGFNEFGCKSKADNVLVKVTPIKELPPRIVLCEGERTELDATNPDPAPATYLWNTGDQRPKIPIFKAGTYTVTVKIKDCIYSQTTEVIYRSLPRLALSRDTLLCFAKPNETEDKPYRAYQHTIQAKLLNMEAGEVYYYDWKVKGTSTLIPEGIGRVEADGMIPLPISTAENVDLTYELRVRMESTKCQTIDEVRVKYNCDGRIKIPSAFTPNDDKLNDIFAPLTSDLTGILVQVYHKWGDIVYEKFIDSKKNGGWDGTFKEEWGWDGTFNGTPVPADNYQYVIVYWSKDRKGFAKRQSVTGSITVIREVTR
jgi:gliding motility-associated-like protein